MHHSAVSLPPSGGDEPAPRARAQLAIEARKARSFSKTFAAAIFDSLGRCLWQAPQVAGVIEAWRGDLASDGVILRLGAGLHAQARSGRIPLLNRIYAEACPQTAPDPMLLDLAVMQALAADQAELLQWLEGPTQTNEVARVAGLAGVLAELAAQRPMPCRLLEIGSSAGLNLNFMHYAIDLGGLLLGAADSAVRLSPRWQGPRPAAGAISVTQAIGVDLRPLDATNPHDTERLYAYVWPGEHARTERLRAAIAIAGMHRPVIAQGGAAEWLALQLASPPRRLERRVVFHSMVLQYVPQPERARIDDILARCGREATEQAPLVRVGIEWNTDRSTVDVRVTCWDGGPRSGKSTLAARCTPYAEAFEWLGPGGEATMRP